MRVGHLLVDLKNSRMVESWRRIQGIIAFIALVVPLVRHHAVLGYRLPSTTLVSTLGSSSLSKFMRRKQCPVTVNMNVDSPEPKNIRASDVGGQLDCQHHYRHHKVKPIIFLLSSKGEWCVWK